ncbi:MAG: CinA family protein [Rhodospirillales bacterium]|nr:CinA family protein [Rhodospirillales bacterium]MDE0711926.1 CinA family protein [Rhodospirillales bacterium]
MTPGSELRKVSAECLRLLDRVDLTLATAESCTGGMIATALTDHPGASRVLSRGFVVYSDDAKEQMLGVPRSVLTACGAVSEEVALAMVRGALAQAPVDLAVAVTGIAGPDGATTTKPVGLVHIAAGRRGDRACHERLQLTGDRQTVREQSAVCALRLLMQTAVQS